LQRATCVATAEVQKFMQLNDKLSSGENAVTLADLPRLYRTPDVGWAAAPCKDFAHIISYKHNVLIYLLVCLID